MDTSGRDIISHKEACVTSALKKNWKNNNKYDINNNDNDYYDYHGWSLSLPSSSSSFWLLLLLLRAWKMATAVGL